MPKKISLMFYYLALEMGVFSLLLLQIVALHPEYRGLSWDLGVVTWLSITAILGWRIHYHMKTNLPIHQNHLYSRLVLFLWVILFCYLMSSILNTPGLKSLFLFIMWIELALFLLGMLTFHYVQTRTEAYLTFGKWFQRQSFPLYTGIGIALLVSVSSMLFPLFRYILSFIPKSILLILDLLAEHFEIFFSWLQYIVPEQAERGIEETEMEFELELVKEEELVVTETYSFSEMGDILFTLLLIAILGFILLKIWKRLKGISFALGKDDQDYKPFFFKMLPGEKLLKSGTRKNKARDRIRRQYQSLLQYAQKKGVLIKQSDTAREWSQRLSSKNIDTLARINQLYEQRRYGQEEISEEEMIYFDQEIKMMKKQIQNEYKK